MGIVFNDEYVKMDETYQDCMYKLYGPTLMGFPQDVDSSRLCMFTSNLKQTLVLKNPDIPRLQTGYENVIGKNNKAYLKLDGQWEVVDRISKFGLPPEKDIYVLILYNKKKDMYDIVEKVVAEQHAEKFGYYYNTEVMDSLQPGDKIKDKVLYKSTSYDKNMNYCTGKSALVYYSSSVDTIEDAIPIRKGWADKVEAVTTDTVYVSVNTNEVLINMAGDENNFKTFPNIGECVDGSTICATRRIVKNHLLYDFQEKNLRELFATDTPYFVTKGSEIYDITVYSNREEEMPDNPFYKQIKYYHQRCCEYADKITEWCKRIKKSGSKYTAEIPYFKSIYQNFNDPEYKWQNKEKNFANVLIEFKVRADLSLHEGFKLVGRYGDKGIISSIADETASVPQAVVDEVLQMQGKEINDENRVEVAKRIEFVEDCRMPYLEDGTYIDIILNAPGSIRRLNTGQLDELDINFISESVRREVCRLNTLEEKRDLIYKFLNILVSEEFEFFHPLIEGNITKEIVHSNGFTVALTDSSYLAAFIKNIEETGFYIVKAPESDMRYDVIKRLYDTFDFIKPLPMYIDLFGIKRKRIMKDGIVAEKYMYLLKHTTQKNFSSRSTGRVNKKNLPEKSSDKRDNRSVFSHNPIRISELYSLFISISATTLAEHNIFMRSSPVGRKSLKKIITASDPMKINKLKVKDNYTNINAEILNAYMKGIGYRINFITGDKLKKEVPINLLMQYRVDGKTIVDTPLNKELYQALFKIYKKISSKIRFVERYRGHKVVTIWSLIRDLDDVKRLNIPDAIWDNIINLYLPEGVTSNDIPSENLIDIEDEEVIVEDDEEVDDVEEEDVEEIDEEDEKIDIEEEED